MTTQLQQLHDLLGMNSQELAVFVEQQVSDNPALEVMSEPISESFGERLDDLSTSADLCIEMIDGDDITYFPHDVSASLRIKDACNQALARAETTEAERVLIKGQMRTAIDLLRNVEHRRQAIYDVVEYLVRQKGCAEPGECLVSLEEAAQAIGKSVSVLALLVRGKRIQTERGLLDLASFFTGDEVAA